MKERAAIVRVLLALAVVLSMPLFKLDTNDPEYAVVVKSILSLTGLLVILFIAFYRTPVERAREQLRKAKLDVSITEVELHKAKMQRKVAEQYNQKVDAE
ncbi:hypothetical protein CH252_04985 [Rhodococcus sp. 06-1477-1B]|nr:hypothetical protein CH252_04985 [Rhodococcus sp. 06-1477-1B]